MINDYRNSQFPSHNISPEKKDGEWLLKFAKAAWGDCYGQQIFYHARELYQELRSYAVGKQTIDRYKPAFGIDEATDASTYNISWETRPVISKYLDIILSIMMDVGRKAIATPIDALAKDKADEYLAGIKAKILMREALVQAGSELAESPYLKPEPGEPQDMEELEMQVNYGFKFNMAREAEQGIELVQYQNNLPIKRQQVCKDLRDLGAGGYKDWLDENGKACFRDCDPQNIIVSYCRRADFADKLYVGEVIEPSVGELSQYFNEEELAKIKQTAKGLTVFNDEKQSLKNDKLKIPVLDLEILTWNDIVYSREINNEGNEVYKKRSYENITNPERVKEKSNIYDNESGDYKSKYFSKKVECWYKICWVIGTDFYYNDGKVRNQKRPKNNLSESESSFHLQAVNFYNMTAQGMVERLKPIVDEYQTTIYRLQDFKNKWLPYIAEIDFDALEAVAYGKGGAVWTPEKIMEFVYANRALIVRKKDIAGINVNYKALEIHPTGMAAELLPLMNDLARLLQEMNDVTGLNPVTDSTGSGERKLKATALLDRQATNNALQPLMFAEKCLFESLSKGCMARLIQAVKAGKVEGVMTALGGNTVKFIKVSPDIALHSWGIKIQDVPTDDDIQIIMEQMGIGEQKGLFRPQDIFMIKSMDNLKAMEQMIGYLYEKRYKEQQAFEMQKITAPIEGNQQMLMVGEKAKQETLQVEYSLKKDFELTKLEKEKELLLLKLEYERGNTIITADGKVKGDVIQGMAKNEAAKTAADATIKKQDIAGLHQQAKQLLANEKPQTAA